MKPETLQNLDQENEDNSRLSDNNSEELSPIKEKDYLGNEALLPFSTSLKADLYIKLKRLEYWQRTSVKEILEEALTNYLDQQPSTKKPLPVKERNKLKQLKTAREYYATRPAKRDKE